MRRTPRLRAEPRMASTEPGCTVAKTMAVVVLNSADLGQVQNTAALAVLVTLAVLVPALPVWLLVRRLRVRVRELVDAR